MEININTQSLSFKSIRNILYISLLTLSFCQFIISDYSISFISINFFILILSSLNICLFLRPKLISKYLFPIFLTFSFNFGALSGPLLFKTLFFQPLFSNLINPIDTFQYLIISNILIIIALLIFINSQFLKFLSSILSSGLITLKNFREPNTKFLNLLFITYFIFWIIIYIYDQGSNSFSDYGSVLIKFMEGTKMLIFVPILYYIKFYLIDQKITRFYFYIFLLFMIFFLGYISFSINGRTVFIQFFIIITFLLMLLIFFTNNKIILFKNKFLIVLILISIFFLNSINSTILMSRSERSTRTTSEQLAYTLDIYKNNKSYEVDELFDNYERYTKNLSVDRLIFPKYFDLFDIEAIENRRDYFINYYSEKFITILPLPVLNFLGYKIDKSNYSISSKSILENVEGGGLFSLGSIVAEFKYVFGSFFVFFWFVFVLLVFVFFHAFQKKNDDKIILSPIALIFIWWIYHFFFTDGIHQSIGIIRQLVQTSIVYYLYYQIFRLKIKL